MGKLKTAIVLGVIPAIVLFSSTVYADTLSDKQNLLHSLNTQSSSLGEQIEKDEQSTQSLKTQIQSETEETKLLQSQLFLTQSKINSNQEQIDVIRKDISDEQKQYDTDRSILSQQLVATYEGEDTDAYIAAIFDAKSFYDMMSDLVEMDYVMKAQNAFAQQVVQEKNMLNTEQSKEQAKQNSLLSEQHSYQTIEYGYQQMLANNKKKVKEMNLAIADAKSKRGVLESQIQLTQQQIAEIEYQTKLDEEQESNTQYVAQQTQSVDNTSANAEQLIQYAETFMNTPYVWGGESPSGFDCSGLVQYVYGHFGIQLPRVSQDQYGVGIPIQESDLEPGDLVFFSTYAPGATHVGIYIGNGLMIDAEDLGVVIDDINNSYWAPKYLGARRVFTNN